MTLALLTFLYDYLPFLIGAVFMLAMALFFAATSDVAERRWAKREVVAAAEAIVRAEVAKVAREEGAGR